MLKIGIAGGGPGSMIGDVHRITAEATGKAKLVCGALSSDYNKSLTKGKEIGLEENRIYKSVDEMGSSSSNHYFSIVVFILYFFYPQNNNQLNQRDVVNYKFLIYWSCHTVVEKHQLPGGCV